MRVKTVQQCVQDFARIESSDCEPEALQRQMNAIRNGSEVHIAGLRRDAGRATDIREYVKSQPLLTAGAAACVGFSVVSSLVGKSESRSGNDDSSETSSETRKATVVSGLTALAGAAATAAFKRWATDYLKGQLVGRGDV